MSKRKRAVEEEDLGSRTSSRPSHNGTIASKKAKTTSPQSFTIQAVVGTYERILHGITATVNIYGDDSAQDGNIAIEFADTFLFNAHGSAIRCLALSPPSKQDKITLVSGGSDQTINLYQLSARRSASRPNNTPAAPSLAGRTIVEDPKNKELGSLQHHAASINALKFPTRSKLLSAADDNTIAIARTRDWTILSTIKIPVPKAHGRPSGDTAPLGGTPTGVNDFAIHPSMKLMVSVSKGEKCMRLWNLVTGKKAGVLNFDKALLQAVGEGQWGRGEGFRVEWNSAGEEFVVGFEKGAVVFGLDSRPKGIITTSPPSKIHQFRYITHEINTQTHSNILAVSTEDGRIVFFSTTFTHGNKAVSSDDARQIPTFQAVGEIGGEVGSSKSRIKDFEFLRVPETGNLPELSLIVTGSSEGSIRVWKLDLLASMERMRSSNQAMNLSKGLNGNHENSDPSKAVLQAGRLLGEYETGNRITCVKAFIMADKCEMEEVSRSPLENMVDTDGGTGTMIDDIPN
ncbi:MAG: hypothetical protein Q9225_000121 [Loekoesia sp. 1 TL-2023]